MALSSCFSASRLLSKHSKHSKKLLLVSLTTTCIRYAHFKDTYLGPGPCDIDLEDGGTKPEGVPESWTVTDLFMDFGRFDENTFPAAKEGETLEQYCRRVPNIWSPCSNANDVVDVMVYLDLVWAHDTPGPTMTGLLEEPLIKIPPETADWHVTYQPDYEGILKDMMFRTRPFPIRVSEDEFNKMLDKFTESVKQKGLAYHFKARSFHEFWEELTGEPLKNIANVPTWEEEINRRIELATAANAQQTLIDNENNENNN